MYPVVISFNSHLIWINSAWILTADEAKRRQQTQLRLVIDNISLPVSSSSIIYDSIMEAWSNALRAIDDLI